MKKPKPKYGTMLWRAVVAGPIALLVELAGQYLGIVAVLVFMVVAGLSYGFCPEHISGAWRLGISLAVGVLVAAPLGYWAVKFGDEE